MANISRSNLSGTPLIDGLAYSYRWDADMLTYGFARRASDFEMASAEAAFSTSTARQRDAVRAALDADAVAGRNAEGFTVEGFTNLDLSESSNAASAHIKVANSSAVPTAFAYLPHYLDIGGDVWFGDSGADPELGSYDYVTVLHELGHALGLTHSHEDNAGSGKVPDHLDSIEYSLMSYRSYVGVTPGEAYTVGRWDFPQSYMMLDIRALQEQYGADFTTNSGNTTYRWTQEGGDTFINGVRAIDAPGNKTFLTIWDGGGYDTYDFRDFTADITIDLRPGEGTILSSEKLAVLDSREGILASANIYNAFQYRGDARSLIERALAGDGDDRVLGNAASNTLRGAGGDDTVFGGDGNDRIGGEAGRDVLDGGAGNDSLWGGDGSDKLSGSYGRDYFSGGSGNDKIWGGAGNDQLNGEAGNDYLAGGAHSDLIRGGRGGDLIGGGGGADSIDGGAGWDRIYGGAGGDRIWGSGGQDKLFGSGGDDCLYGGRARDVLRGGAGQDCLYGQGGADRLEGGAGNDVLDGGWGRDVLIGGAGADRFVFGGGVGAKADRLRADENGIAFEGAGAAAGDVMDLRMIDANAALDGDQAFVFGKARGAGCLWAEDTDNSETVIRGNVDADDVPEIEIYIADGAGVSALDYAAGDFYL